MDTHQSMRDTQYLQQCWTVHQYKMSKLLCPISIWQHRVETAHEGMNERMNVIVAILQRPHPTSPFHYQLLPPCKGCLLHTYHCWQPRNLPPFILQEDDLSNFKALLPPPFGRACHGTFCSTVTAWAACSQCSLLSCLPHRLKDKGGEEGSGAEMTRRG